MSSPLHIVQLRRVYCINASRDAPKKSNSDQVCGQSTPVQHTPALHIFPSWAKTLHHVQCFRVRIGLHPRPLGRPPQDGTHLSLLSVASAADSAPNASTKLPTSPCGTYGTSPSIPSSRAAATAASAAADNSLLPPRVGDWRFTGGVLRADKKAGGGGTESGDTLARGRTRGRSGSE